MSIVLDSLVKGSVVLDDSVKESEDKIEKVKENIIYRVQNRLKRFAEKAVEQEKDAGIGTEAIKQRNRNCGVPENLGLLDDLQEVQIKGDTKIEDILRNMATRKFLGDFYAAY